MYKLTLLLPICAVALLPEMALAQLPTQPRGAASARDATLKSVNPAALDVDQRLREARLALNAAQKNMAPAAWSTLDTALREAELAFATYVDLALRDQDRERALAPLAAAGAVVVADDVTGVGVADDVLLPLLGLAAAVTLFRTNAAATPSELTNAWRRVGERIDAFRKALERTVRPLPCLHIGTEGEGSGRVVCIYLCGERQVRSPRRGTSAVCTENIPTYTPGT